jgi:hypothetical protein
MVTAGIFGLLTIVHIWRAIEESPTLAHDPWFLGITALSALLCGWAVRLLVRERARLVR